MSSGRFQRGGRSSFLHQAGANKSSQMKCLIYRSLSKWWQWAMPLGAGRWRDVGRSQRKTNKGRKSSHQLTSLGVSVKVLVWLWLRIFEQNTLFFFRRPPFSCSRPVSLPPSLPAFLPSFSPANSLYLQLSSVWRGWIDMGGCSWGNIFLIMLASKKWLPSQSFQPRIVLIRQHKRKNTLALPERGFGKNQVCGTEWTKVILNNKPWSVAGAVPSLTRTAWFLTPCPVPHEWVVPQLYRRPWCSRDSVSLCCSSLDIPGHDGEKQHPQGFFYILWPRHLHVLGKAFEKSPLGLRRPTCWCFLFAWSWAGLRSQDNSGLLLSLGQEGASGQDAAVEAALRRGSG